MRVRTATASDADALVAIYAEGIEDRTSTFETEAPSAASMRSRIAAPDEIHLVAEDDDGAVVGWAATEPYTDRECYAGIAEVSFYVRRDARGGGIGAALAAALADEARSRGKHKLLGKLFVENEASRRLLARCGFREVGVHLRHGRQDEEWRDVLLVEMVLV